MIEPGCLQKRFDNHKLRQKTDGGHGCNGQENGQCHGQPCLLVKEVDQIKADHDKLPVGEMDDLDHAEDQVKTKGEECKNTSKEDSVYQRIK